MQCNTLIKIFVLFPLFALFLLRGESFAQTPELSAQCMQWFQKLPSATPQHAVVEDMKHACELVTALPRCTRPNGSPVFHLDAGNATAQARRVLVLGLIHGDEPRSGGLARDWLIRLSKIAPRNAWRVVPVLNPDGWAKNTRTNGNSVDLNRNFPTSDWESQALKFWKKATRSNPRRFPGEKAGSEWETQCALSHIDDFKPDLIVSIHTPYGVLDFDGPRVKFPRFKSMPYRPLGNFPGSLGRLMWVEKEISVFTVELPRDGQLISAADAERMQDWAGNLAILTAQERGKGVKRTASQKPLDAEETFKN